MECFVAPLPISAPILHSKPFDCSGLYPGVLLLVALLLTAPLVLPAAFFGWLPWMAAPAPAAGLLIAYYVFWGLYPPGAGNFNSQCVRQTAIADCVDDWPCARPRTDRSH